MALTAEMMHGAECHLDGLTVHKPTVGTNGGRMRLVSADAAVSPLINRRQAFLQEFLDVDAGRPFDVRVYVIGGQVVGAMKRHAPAHDWRTNVAIGGSVEGFTDRPPRGRGTREAVDSDPRPRLRRRRSAVPGRPLVCP